MLRHILKLISPKPIEEVPHQPVPPRDPFVEGFNEWNKHIQRECKKQYYPRKRK